MLKTQCTRNSQHHILTLQYFLLIPCLPPSFLTAFKLVLDLQTFDLALCSEHHPYSLTKCAPCNLKDFVGWKTPQGIRELRKNDWPLMSQLSNWTRAVQLTKASKEQRQPHPLSPRVCGSVALAEHPRCGQLACEGGSHSHAEASSAARLPLSALLTSVLTYSTLSFPFLSLSYANIAQDSKLGCVYSRNTKTTVFTSKKMTCLDKKLKHFHTMLKTNAVFISTPNPCGLVSNLFY